MKSTFRIIMLLAVMAMAAPASAHQLCGTLPIDHSLPPVGNLNYQGNMTAKEAYQFLISAPIDKVILLDVRSPFERNGSQGGCISQVALGIWVDPYNSGTPFWQHNQICENNITSPTMPVHVQSSIGVAFNAKASDGTDLVGWPFRAVGYMIINPDFDNYIRALEAEGIMATDKVVIVMCASGWRAKYVADYLTTAFNYEKVYVMDGGLSAWKQAGFPVSTSESDWVAWDPTKLYDPARLAPYGGAKWPHSVFLRGGDQVIPEWMGQYVPPSNLVGYVDATCTAPGNLVGLNGPWPKDKRIDDLGIVPTLTSVKLPEGWTGPTLNSQCIQTMMGFKGLTYEQAVAACASAPAVVPGYFDAWPIKKGYFIEQASLPLRGEDDPCGDFYTSYFGTGWYPANLSYCEKRAVETQVRDCNNGDPLCSGTRTYCWANAPFGYPKTGATLDDWAYCENTFGLPAPCGGFTPKTDVDGKFWTPDLTLNCDFMFAQ